MLHKRLFLSVATLLALFATWMAPARAEERDPQTQTDAVDLLLQAQLQYQNRNFDAARTSFEAADEHRAELTAEQQQMLDEKQRQIAQAIARQNDARQLYREAEKALAEGRIEDARRGFRAVADNAYLPAEERSLARRRLVAARNRTGDDGGEVLLAAAVQTPGGDDEIPEIQPVDAVEPDEAPADTPTVEAEEVIAPQPEPVEADVMVVDETPAPVESVEPVDAGAEDIDTVIVVDEPAPDRLDPARARSIKVGQLIAEGQQALNQAQPEKAVRKFERALQLDPDNREAERLLERSRMLTATGASGRPAVLNDLVKQRQIQKEMAVHDIQQALKRSMELMAARDKEAEDFDAAEQAARTGRSILQNNKAVFPDTEYREFLSKLEDQIAWVRDKREEYNQQQVAEELRQIEEQQREAEARMKRQQQEKISQLTLRVRELIDEKAFQQALRVVEEIQDIEPTNNYAQETAFVLQNVIQLDRSRFADRLENSEGIKISTDIRMSEIPWYDKIRYPADWIELSEKRLQYSASLSAESEEDRRARQKLQRRIANVPLQGVRFVDAIAWLKQQTGANFFVNWRALDADLPDARDIEINLDLSDVTAKVVLDKILADAGGGFVNLSYVIKDGVINIDTQDRLSEQTYVVNYDVRDLGHILPDFEAERVNLEAIGGNDSNGGGGNDDGGGGLFGGDDDDDDDEDDEDVLTRSEMSQKIIDMIKQGVGPEEWDPTGPGTISDFNGNLLIRQTAENHRKVQSIVSQLRETRTIQVSIEARFITVNTGFLNQIGIDLDFYFNLGSQIHQGGTDELIGDKGPSEWQEAGYNPNTSFEKVTPIGVLQNSAGFANLIGTSTSVPNSIGGIVSQPALSISGTFLDDLQVDFLIRATKAHSSTRSLTAPRLTLFNGQRAYVSVTRNQAYVAGIDADFGADNAQGIAVPDIRYAPTGAILDVDATVSHDRRYVILTLRPQVLTLNNDPLTDTVEAAGVQIGLPNMTLQDIQTTVSVPDGGTLLIGGQQLSGEREREMGVPAISHLPVVNRAFTNKAKMRDEESLLILVKPQIIINDEVENDPRLYLEEDAFEPGFGYRP